MNQNLSINFVKVINDRTYTFSLPVGAPFGEAYDVCHEVLMQINGMASAAAEKAKSAPVDSLPEEIVS
jgi:hypothetical protein